MRITAKFLCHVLRIKPSVSSTYGTGESGFESDLITYGYGELSEHGEWQFPLREEQYKGDNLFLTLWGNYKSNKDNCWTDLDFHDKGEWTMGDIHKLLKDFYTRIKAAQ